MRYIIEDTHGGFRLTLGETKDTRHIFDEPGGHGPLERLYVEAQQTADDLRARRRMGSSMSVTLTKDNIATAARYNDADSEELGGLEQWADRYDVSIHGLMYVAEQRAMRIGLLRDGRDPRREVSPTRFTTIQLSTATRREMIHYQSAWVDGFACGLRAERIRS